MTKPLVSIIVPVYKVEKYLIDCINSLISQTYVNLEIILVDDGSPDKCPQICDEYACKDSRIKVIHKTNGGLSSARNAGINSAIGDYIYFVDSDDALPEDSIQSLVEKLLDGEDIEIVIGQIISIPNNEYYKLEYVNDNIKTNAYYRYLYYKYGKTFPVNAVGKLIKKTFLIENSLLFREGIIHEDELWTFYVVKYLKNAGFVDRPVYIRYYREGSIMTTLTFQKETQVYSSILLEESRNIDDCMAPLQILKCSQLYFKYQIAASNSQNKYAIIKNLIKKSFNYKCYYIFIVLSLWYATFFIHKGKRLNERMRMTIERKWIAQSEKAHHKVYGIQPKIE